MFYKCGHPVAQMNELFGASAVTRMHVIVCCIVALVCCIVAVYGIVT